MIHSLVRLIVPFRWLAGIALRLDALGNAYIEAFPSPLMVMLDVLSNALVSIKNAEVKGRRQVIIWPSSKLVGNVLRVMQRYGYIGEFEYVHDGRGGKYIVQLLGKINDVGAIKPRFHVKVDELIKWEEKYLPARQIGILILSTSSGVLSHLEARERRVGGVLLAYVY